MADSHDSPDFIQYLIKLFYFQQEIWDLALKKLTILKHGYLLKVSIEKYQVAHHVGLSKREEWGLNINHKMETNL